MLFSLSLTLASVMQLCDYLARAQISISQTHLARAFDIEMHFILDHIKMYLPLDRTTTTAIAQVTDQMAFNIS